MQLPHAVRKYVALYHYGLGVLPKNPQIDNFLDIMDSTFKKR